MKYEEWIKYERARLAAQKEAAEDHPDSVERNEGKLIDGETIEMGRPAEGERRDNERGIFPA